MELNNETLEDLSSVPVRKRPGLTAEEKAGLPIEEELLSANPYDPVIPRRLMEGICGCNTNHLVKYEQEGLITPIKARRGGLEVVVYKASDIRKVLKRRSISFKKKDLAEVIAVFSQKGGVGKSAFTQHLGAILSLVGKVLIIDLDSQGDVTNLLDVNRKYNELLTERNELDPTIAELMDWTLSDGSDSGYRKLSFDEVVKKLSPTLDVIPAELDLGEINYSLNRLPLAERVDANGNLKHPPELYMVKDVVDKLRGTYDYILFDCPPNIETLNVSALLAANRILIPLELEAKCILTIRRNQEFLKRLTEMHSGFQWDKILIVPNKYKRENIKLKAFSFLQDMFSNRTDLQLSEIAVPLSAVVDRCSYSREPVFVMASRHGRDYRSVVPLAKEFTNYFWVIMHEILDVEVQHLIFPENGAGEA
jgi:cellulose biosynthesis protein BcsQ